MTHTLTREFDEDYSVSLAVTGHPSLHDLADIMQGWLIAQGIHYETAKRLQFVVEAEEQEGSSDGLANAYMLGMYDGSHRCTQDADSDQLPPADPALLASANRMLLDRLEGVAHVLRGCGLEKLKDITGSDDLQMATSALAGAFQMALADAARLDCILAEIGELSQDHKNQ